MPTIKVRKSEHESSFRCKEKMGATKLSEVIWEEKAKGIESILEWSKIKRVKARGANQKSCALCNTETHEIMMRSKLSINDREELGGYCPHRRAHLIVNIQENKENLKEERAENKRKKEEFKKRKYG